MSDEQMINTLSVYVDKLEQVMNEDPTNPILKELFDKVDEVFELIFDN